MESVKEPSNWREAIQQLEHSKKHLPWDPKRVEPIVRISKYERKREEREVDPITLKYRDEARQTMAEARRAEVMNMRLTTSTNMLNSTFNIVSHIGPPRTADQRPRPNTRTSHRDFNFVTNMKLDDHTNAPTLYDEHYVIEKVKEAKPHRASTSHVPIRDYNMISNDYYTNNSDRKSQEFRQLKEELTKKYWDTHNYDPIKVQYYDENKEEQFIEQRQTLTEVHGTAGILKLPPSVQYSDGNSFDILNHSVHDEQRLKATRVMEERQLNRIKGMTLQPQMRDKGIADYDRKQDMKLQRVSYKRWEQQRERGFDLVTNTGNTDKPAPLPPKPKDMWERITMTLPSEELKSLKADRFLDDLRNELAPPPSNRIRNLSGGTPVGLRLGTAPAAVGAQFGLMGQSTSTPDLARANQRFSASNNNNNNNGDSARFDSARSNLNSYRSEHSGAGGVAAAAAVGQQELKYYNNNRQTNTAGANRPVPSLDLDKTEFAEPVSYTEPVFGGKGLAIPIKRTTVTGGRE